LVFHLCFTRSYRAFFQNKVTKIELGLYVLGTILYFSSWAAHIYFPETAWSQILLGFMAPAYTTIIWLIGIGLIGQYSFFKIPHISLYYIIASIYFVIVHSLHPYFAFEKH
jgi:hypothetical protein